MRKQSKSKQLRRRRRSRAENQTCKSDSSYCGKNASRQGEPKNGDLHRLAEDCSNRCYRVGTVESVPNSTNRKMVKDQVRCEKIIANSSSVTVGRTLKSAEGKEKYPEWKLARRKEYKNGRRRKGMKRVSPGIRFRRGKKSSSEQLRPHGVEADGSRVQASVNMPGEAIMQGIPDLRESQMFHKRWKTSIARRKVDVCICSV